MAKPLNSPLAQAWRAKGLTPETFAKACGISLTHTYDLAAGRRNPSAATLATICRVLEATPEELFPELFTRIA